METNVTGWAKNEGDWFKSYYVVWKQKILQEIQTHWTCLNRTMQYGNAGGSSACLCE